MNAFPERFCCHTLPSIFNVLLGGMILCGPMPLLHGQYAPPTNGLVSWWKADGNGIDSIGGHNGIVGNQVGFVAGVDGQAFSFSGGYGDSRISVPDSDAFQLTNSLTIAAWVKVQGNSWKILERGDSRSSLDPYSLSFDYDSSRLLFAVTDANNNHTSLETPNALPWNRWMQITATLDGTTGTMRIYVDAALLAETNTSIRPFGTLIPSMNPGIGIGDTLTYAFPFVGAMDDVLLYSRALTTSEVGVLAQVPTAPQLTLQPKGTTGYWGGSAQFEADATGFPAPDFQWYKDGFPISWATNYNLVLQNLDFTDAGSYTVEVSNSQGRIMSDPALLVVNPAGVSIGLHPFLTVAGTVGKSFGIQYTTNVSQTSSWISITNLTLTQPVQEWVDTSIDVNREPKRFYRLVTIPTP
jgi:hypothetical protein